MRYSALIGIVAVTVCLLVVGALRFLTNAPVEEDLSAAIEARVALWTNGRVPLSGRIVTLLLIDGDSEGELLGGSLTEGHAAQRAEFLKEMESDPAVLPFNLGRNWESREDHLVGVLADAILKANEAGAEVNVVTVGGAVFPALKALASLAGKSVGDIPVGVNKLITLGVDRERSTAPLEAPENLLEWATLCMSRLQTRSRLVLSSRGMRAASHDGEALLRLGSMGRPVVYPVSGALLAGAVGRLSGDVREMRTIMAEAAPPAAPEPENESAGVVRRKRTFRALNGTVPMRSANAETDRPSRPAAGGSLGMVVKDESFQGTAGNAEKGESDAEGESWDGKCLNKRQGYLSGKLCLCRVTQRCDKGFREESIQRDLGELCCPSSLGSWTDEVFNLCSRVPDTHACARTKMLEKGCVPMKESSGSVFYDEANCKYCSGGPECRYARRSGQ